MAEDPTPSPPARARPRRGLRRAAWVLGAAGTLVLIAAGALAWLGSESGLQWLAARTPLRLGTKQITLKDVQGSLWRSVRIGQLQLVTADSTTTLYQARLHWTPAELWHRTLHIQSFSAQRLDIAQTHAAPAKGPLELPASLRLPLRIDLDRFDLGALQIGPPGVLQPYGRFTGELHYGQGRYRARLNAVTPWAQAQLQAQLGDSAPYALQATLNATHIGLAGHAAAGNAADLRAQGTLRDLSLNGTLQMDAAHARLQAHLTPFDATPLRSARLTARALDPAAFSAALPRAALDVQFDLGPSSAQRLSGELQVRNALPGPIDQRRLPLRSLSATLAGDGQQAAARDLRIDLGPGGQIHGTLTWTRPTLQARLQVAQLNARALDGKLAATRLSGPVAIDASAQQQSAQIALAQPGWDLRMEAQRRGDAVQLQRLRLAAPGGRLDASGTLSTGGAQPFDLRASLRQFDPAQFGAYPQARLSADLTARGTLAQRQARLALQLAPSVWRGHTFTGHARLALDRQRLWDVDAALALGANQLQAKGAFGRPDDALQWTLTAPQLAQIDDTLQGSAEAQGQLRGGLQAPAGKLTLQADGVRWGKALALHHLSARSSFSTARASPATATSLDTLLDRLAGSLQVDLDGLDWHQDGQTVQLHSLQTQAQTTAGLKGQLDLKVRLQQLRLAGLGKPQHDTTLSTASLDVTGTRAQHSLALDAQGQLPLGGAESTPPTGASTAAQQPLPVDLHLRAQGGWLGAPQGWRGQITALDNSGPLAFKLQAPAALDLAFAPLRLQLQHAALQLQAGHIDLNNLQLAPGLLRTDGRMSAVQTADLLRLAGIAPARLRDTLVLSGDWKIDAGASVEGHVHLQRDSGDIALQVAAPPAKRVGTVKLGPTCDATFGPAASRDGFMPLDIGQLVLDLTAHEGRLQAQGVLQTGMGTVQASGHVQLSRRGDLWGVAADAPLQLDAGADMPSLAWAAPLIGYDYRAEGRLQLAVQGRGTLAAPQFSGSLEGRALRLAWPAQGLDLKNGVLRAHFTGDRLQLDQLQLQGGKGQLTATGDARLQNGLPRATLDLKADKLQLLSRPDRQLVLSGTAQAQLADKVLALTTNLTADRADIALPRASGPTLSSDVVIKGQTPAASKPPAAMPNAVRFDGTFNLGSNFHLYGQGLDAMLGGSVRVRADNGATPTATGSIEVVQGEYTAYGQQLQVTQGRVNFAGPVDNPGLNITATRPNLPTGIEVGVNIGGTARRPLIKLSSTPAMPDTEILSWLVLGQPLSQVGASDIGLLQTAAAALLGPSDGQPLQTRLAHAVGLDSISVQSASSTDPLGTSNATGTSTTSTNGLPSTVLTLSKRLSSNTLVTFSRGLNGVSNIFNIQYQLTRRLSVQAQTGTENAVDLFYTFEFR
ncbi:translocation/assembly module TamB domain-containing protein [Thiomonas intermedia]|uniref:translocation/assembly module TamB domain-containing protein n=1 Tax=Thiomonas intermedia TaxID=926 RepID=UPI0009A4E1F2|nr:translocation/assembly module TamB domain-containing protein [Thiomonas intermedia]